MKLVNTKIWKTIKKNKIVYGFIHNTIGKHINQKKMNERIKEMINNGEDCIAQVETVLKKTDIIFFTDFGTLLGFVREGKTLSWDYDIDYGIIIKSDGQWNDLHKAMSGIGFKLIKQFSYKGVVTEKTYGRGNIYIDFFRHFVSEKDSHYYVYYTKQGYSYQSDNMMHVRMTTTVRITETKEFDVDNGTVSVPLEYEKYLEDVFGEDWRIPNPNWVASAKDNITFLDGFGLLLEYDKNN